MRRTLWLAVAVLAATASVGAAQETTTGSIAGQIVDPQGLPLPGVTITITSPQGVQTFTTDERGRFLAPFLAPGTYTVRSELAGFKPIDGATSWSASASASNYR